MKPATTLRILIVDDEQIVCETLAAIMHHLGHTAEWIHDGLGGRQALQDKVYDAVFLDMKMPGLDGLSLLKWIREKKLGLPIIIMTGHGTEDSQREALENGAFAFLYKPFALAEIKLLLQRLSQRRLSGQT